MRGWIIDCYPDYGNNNMVLWVRGAERAERKMMDYLPEVYIWAPREDIRNLPRKLEKIGFPHVSIERRKPWLGAREREVVRVGVPVYSQLCELSTTVDRWGDHYRYQLFNVDIRLDQRFLLEKGVFPMGLTNMDRMIPLDSPWRHEYPLPNLREVVLDVEVRPGNGIPTFDNPLKSVEVNDVILDGQEDEILEGLSPLVREKDPDIVYTNRGMTSTCTI